MKMCLSLVHLITLISVLTQGAVAQADLPSARIVTVNLDPQNVTVLHLRRGYVSSVRLPEEVSSVVLGDPGAFKAEHSEAEPQLVFFKPTTPKPTETNALITTRTGARSLLKPGERRQFNSRRGDRLRPQIRASTQFPDRIRPFQFHDRRHKGPCAREPAHW